MTPLRQSLQREDLAGPSSGLAKGIIFDGTGTTLYAYKFQRRRGARCRDLHIFEKVGAPRLRISLEPAPRLPVRECAGERANVDGK